MKEIAIKSNKNKKDDIFNIRTCTHGISTFSTLVVVVVAMALRPFQWGNRTNFWLNQNVLPPTRSNSYKLRTINNITAFVVCFNLPFPFVSHIILTNSLKNILHVQLWTMIYFLIHGKKSGIQ